ncbi:FHA domain-containing protein [Chitinophaga sp. Hz27]|uniref:FHA domain-containing protein n=1 Tax=Chitinophaga sp. Hz27 TaxID=3347169 RepID=UPI0035DDCB32
MASIINAVTEELIILTPLFTFGRNPSTVTLHLPFSDVSQSHASIFWSRDGWFLRDHSRNGTLLDGEHLWHLTKKLTKTHNIQFGSDTATQWKIADLDPPFPFLKSLHRRNEYIRLSFVTALTIDERQEAAIYYLPDSGWIYEQAGDIIPLLHGDSIHFANDEWEFVSAVEIEETIDQRTLTDKAIFIFHLSIDEEHIRLELSLNGHTSIDLGNRSHNYLLLSLARRRYTDHQQGLPTTDLGWCVLDDILNDLSRELQKEVDVYFLNLQIFRLRKMLCDIPDVGYIFSNIIERRPGEIRLGHPYFTILKGDDRLADIRPR